MSTNKPIYIGAGEKLKDLDLPRIGSQIGVGEDPIHALIEVETVGHGFDDKGRVIILFEPHVFYALLKHDPVKLQEAVNEGLAYPKQGTRPYPRDSYPRLIKAMAIDETAALMACSWGMGQVMGQNFHMLHYNSVQEMVAAFAESEANQLQGMIDFIKSAKIDDDLRRIQQISKSGRVPSATDWISVVRTYNGAGFAKNNYHYRAAAAYAKWLKIKDTPFAPTDMRQEAVQETDIHGPVMEPHPIVISGDVYTFVGDSMLEGTSPVLGKIPGVKSYVHFKRGTMTSYWVGQVAKFVAAEDPSKVVFFLGTNDDFNNRPILEIVANVKKLIAEVGDRDYIWVGPPASPKLDKDHLNNVVDAIKRVVGNNYYDARVLKLSYQPDKIHPTMNSFAAWAHLIISKLETDDTDLEAEEVETPTTLAVENVTGQRAVEEQPSSPSVEVEHAENVVAAPSAAPVPGGAVTDPVKVIRTTAGQVIDEIKPYITPGIGVTGKASLGAAAVAILGGAWKFITSPLGLALIGVGAGFILFWLITRYYTNKHATEKQNNIDIAKIELEKLKLQAAIQNQAILADGTKQNVVVLTGSEKLEDHAPIGIAQEN
jgi:hypothetical protein